MPLPPSDNKIYFNLKYGGRALTKDATKFKNLVKVKIAKLSVTDIISFKKNIPYRIKIKVFTKLYNKGWPEKAKDRFKRVDTLNRTKLLVDAITEAIGIDDKHIVSAIVEKEDSEVGKVTVTLEEL